DLGLSFAGLRKLGLQNLCYSAMMLSSLRKQKRLIGCILDQCVSERVGTVLGRAGGQNDLRSYEPPHSGSDELARLPYHGTQKVGFEFPPDYGGKLCQFPRFGTEPVEPRQQ